MSEKAYKKIYVNGDCVVDFTKQTADEYSVSCSQTLFNQKGELVQGKDDTFLFTRDSYLTYSAYEVCGFLTDPTIYLNNSAISIPPRYDILAVVSSGVENNTFKARASTVFLSEANLIALLHSTSFDSQSGFNIIVPTVKNLSSVQLEALHQLSEYCGMQIFIMDTKPTIDTFSTGYIIYNCSNICRTVDGVFSYVKASDKAYIVGIYADALNQMLNSSNNVLTFPDSLEGLPVVSLGGCILKGRFFVNNWKNIDIAEIKEIHLPNKLEVIGAESFNGHNHSGLLTKMTLPRTLHTFLYNTYTINNYCNHPNYPTFGSAVEAYYELSLEPAEDDNCYFPENLNTAPEILNSIIRGVSATSESLYIPTQTNPFYVYTGRGETSENIIIPEGCNYMVPPPYYSSSIASITFPSTLKTYPILSGYNTLTVINFADSMASMTATEIPDYFANGCSNITAINIPEGITAIGSNAFYNCTNLKDITLPSTLTSIDSDAFYGGKNETTGKVIHIKATNPPSLYNVKSLAYNVNNISEIIVPAGCLNAYQTAPNWKDYALKMKVKEA
jgi:hypothetical protein